MATTSFSTTFNLVLGPKQFIFEDTFDYVGAGIPLSHVNGVFKITSPSGIVIYNNTDYSNSGCDIWNNSSRLNQQDIQLPLAANSYPELGDYTVVYSVYDSTLLVYYTQTNTYTYSYVSPTICIEQDIDCVSPLLTSTDATTYTVDSVVPTKVEVHTIYYPADSAGYASPTIGSTLVVSTSTFYNGTQTTVITSGLTYVFSDDLIVIDEITGSQEVLVDCTDTCAIYCCIRTLEQTMLDQSTMNRTAYPATALLFSQVMGLVGLVTMARTCSKSADISGYLTAIKTLAHCKDDCSCTGTTPTQVYGLSGLVNNVIVNSCGTPVTVTPVVVGNTTTYTVCLDPAFVTLVNSLYNTVVVAGTNITSVTDSGIIAGVRTFTVNAAAAPAAAIVLSNDTTDIATSGAGVDALMSYAVPANTLATNGSVLEIETSYTMSATSQSKTLAYTLNGVNLISKLPTSPGTANTITIPKDLKYATVKITITRKTVTTVYITVDVRITGSFYSFAVGALFNEGTGAGVTVADLSANTLTLACFGENYDGTSNTETITQNQLLVKYFNK